jgi:hypothetical protein
VADLDFNLPQHKPEVIPHAAQSLSDIQVKAAAFLSSKKREKFLHETFNGWVLLYNKYVARFPLDDASDFKLMLTGIRRLIERG